MSAMLKFHKQYYCFKKHSLLKWWSIVMEPVYTYWKHGGNFRYKNNLEKINELHTRYTLEIKMYINNNKGVQFRSTIYKHG